jgi:hypothetical protein
VLGIVLGVHVFEGLAIFVQLELGGVTTSKISVSKASSSKVLPSKVPKPGI